MGPSEGRDLEETFMTSGSPCHVHFKRAALLGPARVAPLLRVARASARLAAPTVHLDRRGFDGRCSRVRWARRVRWGVPDG